MKTAFLGAAALAAALCAGRASAAPAVTGDYVEARSANVFVGACHHEGEIQTAGRNAVLAWKITDGEYQGVSLKGVSAVATVSSDRNMELPGAKRRSVLYVGSDASAAQRDALAALLKERAPSALGELISVKSAPVTFDSRGDMYRVQVAGLASMQVKKQTAELCCKQPYEVWGKPLLPVQGAKAGHGLSVEYRDPGLLQKWSSTGQNNAFFGQFAL